MEEYLITARSVTQAQRMAQLLERRGVRAVVGRAPMGLTGKGCGYVLRLRGQNRTVAALRLEGEVKIDIFSKGLRQKDLGVLRPVRGRIVFLRATLETNRSGDQQSRLRQSSSRLPVLTCRRSHRLASVFPR